MIEVKTRFKIKIKGRIARNRLALIILSFLIVAFIVNLLAAKKSVAIGLKIINPTRMQIFLNYKQKLCLTVGIAACSYYDFVKANTPEDAVILIPPQGFPWPMIGNMAYSRYFLYPRRILSGKEKEPGRDLVKEGVEYVLIHWGETKDTEYDFTHVWPKFSLPAEKIIYKPAEDRLDAEVVKKDYDPKDPKNARAWGIIVLDRERLR